MTCRNCDTSDPARNIEEGLCERCFRSMPMDVWITPGRWDPAPEDD